MDFTVKALFKILGWKFAEDGPKAPPFSKILTALGVVMDVSNLHNGVIVIDNTESRRIELARSIEEILQSKQLRRLDALRLRGRMQFAAGQLFGRVARRCLSVVTQHAYGMDNASVSESALSSLQRFRDMLLAGSPRTLSSHRSSVWFIFTDAAHEPDSESPFTGIGAVLVDELGSKQRFFSEWMDDEMLNHINVSKRKTIIFECEFFALLCALVTWRDLLFRCSLVLHTDNDAVRDCFISCHTTGTNSIPILDACLKCERELECNAWITRVPTELNIADDPSRFEIQPLTQCGCVRDPVQCGQIWQAVVAPSGRTVNGGGDAPRHANPT